MNVWFGRVDTKDKYYKRIKNVQTAEKVCQIVLAFDLNHNSSSGLENFCTITPEASVYLAMWRKRSVREHLKCA